MAADVEALRRVVLPALDALGLDLYDLDLRGGGRARTLKVLVDREGGVDLDTITRATRAVSERLDATDVLHGSYLLEVSSPGVERPLRVPAHYARAVGETVSVKVHTDDGPRRYRGTLAGADARGCTIDVDGEPVRVAYDDVTAARTVFEWGPAPRPGKGSRPGKGAPRRGKEHVRS